MDRLNAHERSKLMAGVRTKNTKPELQLRSMLHRMGYRYRLHRADLPGHPDVVLPSRRIVIFVHGCFWHQHPGCTKATLPTTRAKWWKAKLMSNVRRDKKTCRSLRKLGWQPLTIWECDLKDQARLADRLCRMMDSC